MTEAEFAAQWQSQNAGPSTSGAIDEHTFARLWESQNQPKPLTGIEKLQGAVYSAGAGPTFGLGDEAAAGIRGGFSGLGALLSGEGLGGAKEAASITYANQLGQIRDVERRYREAYPGTSTTLEIAASLGPGIASIASAGGKAALAQGAKEVARRSAAGQIARGAGTGAAMGGLYGFGTGEGSADRRFMQAIDSGLMGAGFGGVVPAAGRTIGALAETEAARAIPAIVKNIGARVAGPLGGETGALAPKAAREVAEQLPALTSEEMMLLRALRDEPLESIQGGIQKLQGAQGREVPLLIREALPEAYTVAADMDALAQVPLGRAIRKEVGSTRPAGRYERITGIVQPGEGADQLFIATNKIKGAAEEMIDSVNKERQRVAKPLFDAAITEKPVLRSKKIATLMDIPEVKATLDTMKRVPELDELGVPIAIETQKTSTRNVQSALKGLGDQISSAKTSGNRDLARRLTAIKRELQTEAERLNPKLGEARKAYAKLSGPFSSLTEGEFAIVQEVAKMKPDQVPRIAKRIMSMEPARIRSMREVFSISNPEAWDEMSKAYLIDILDNIKDNADVVGKITGTAKARARLDAAFGTEGANRLITALEEEALMHETRALTARGSQTQPRQQAMERLGLTAGAAQGPDMTKAGMFRRVWNAAFKRSPDTETLTRYSDLLAGTEPGIAALERVQPHLAQQQNYQDIVRALQTGANYGLPRAGIVEGTR